jgi:hypothetical protein
VTHYSYLPEETKRQITTEPGLLTGVWVEKSSPVEIYDTATGTESAETLVLSIVQKTESEPILIPDVLVKRGLYVVTHGSAATVFYS